MATCHKKGGAGSRYPGPDPGLTIYKGRGSRASMGAYQGITVLYMDTEASMALLLHCPCLNMEERMHDAQHGFRSVRSTPGCLFNLHRLVELA